MKKIMFFVAAFMAVSFAACGGSNNDGKSKEPVNKEQTVKDSLNKVAAKAAEDAANKAAEGVEASKKAAKEIGEAAKEKATGSSTQWCTMPASTIATACGPTERSF